jgi:hypothetical protein
VSATVVAFPPCAFTQADSAQLRRWSAKAQRVAGCRVLAQPEGALTGRTKNGTHYADIGLEGVREGVWRVLRERRRWVLVRARDGEERSFANLPDALQAVCRC